MYRIKCVAVRSAPFLQFQPCCHGAKNSSATRRIPVCLAAAPKSTPISPEHTRYSLCCRGQEACSDKGPLKAREVKKTQFRTTFHFPKSRLCNYIRHQRVTVTPLCVIGAFFNPDCLDCFVIEDIGDVVASD